jgi:hypothetical protein
MKDNNGCGGVVFSELIKLLLKEPREKAVKHKSRNSSSQKSDAGPATIITEHVVREYPFIDFSLICVCDAYFVS